MQQKFNKITYLFPGQGAQYVGMGKDFAENFSIARQTFEEADDILKRKLSKNIFEGPEDILTATKNSQVAIFTTSIAILRSLQTVYPHLQPYAAAGLSLGEYTALFASGRLSFGETLQLVQTRGELMNHACETTKGTMAVILGLDADTVEKMVQEARLPNDLWVANFNCPGQVVISGTLKGIETGSDLAKRKGAKRILPLTVHGAFHSGLMREAEERLAEHVHNAQMQSSTVKFVMNVTGQEENDLNQIKTNLIKQVTGSVRWEQGIRYLNSQAPDLFLEIGCGKVLSGFNKKIGVSGTTISIEKVDDLKLLE